MWQSLTFKFVQPHDDTCHNPPLTKLTNHTLPRHHLLNWNPNPNLSPLPPWQPPSVLQPVTATTPESTNHGSTAATLRSRSSETSASTITSNFLGADNNEPETKCTYSAATLAGTDLPVTAILHHLQATQIWSRATTVQSLAATFFQLQNRSPPSSFTNCIARTRICTMSLLPSRQNSYNHR